jgi:hypothetical protein
MMVLAVVFADDLPGNKFFNELKADFAEVWPGVSALKYKSADDEGTVYFSVPYDDDYFAVKNNSDGMGAFVLGYLRGNGIEVGLVSMGGS